MAPRTFMTAPTLYNLCINSFLEGLKQEAKLLENNEPLPLNLKFNPPSQLTLWQLEFMPTLLVADILLQMAWVVRFKGLVLNTLSNLNILNSLLQHETTTCKLVMCLGLMKDRNPSYVKKLPKSFFLHWKKPVGLRRTSYSDLIDFGLRLGSFLSDSGWMLESIQILKIVEMKIRLLEDNESATIQLLDCLQRRLHCETIIWEFNAGRSTIKEISRLVSAMDLENISDSLIVEIYTRSSEFHLLEHKYEEAYRCSDLVVQHISESMPKRILVDALRSIVQVCVAKRELELANILLEEAISLTAAVFGPDHLKFADVLSDFAYILLLFDKNEYAINIYGEVSRIRLRKLSNQSFLMSLTNAALANACCVRKHRALKLVQRALRVMVKMLPAKNLLLVSTFRLHFLIKYKITFDKYERFYKTTGLLRFSTLLKIQIDCVKLCLDIHDKMNLITAKNYFELARIYQASHKYLEYKRCIAKYLLIINAPMGSSEKEINELHTAERYLYKTNILRKVQTDPWLLNRIESSELLRSYNPYEPLSSLYCPTEKIRKYLISSETTRNYHSKSSSQQSNNFWWIRFIREVYLNESETQSQ